MSQSNKGLAFRQLLEFCSNPDCPQWQFAWSEFIRRYKKYMYNVILNRCLMYKNGRMRRQLSEVVNDIFSNATAQLYKNNCRALQEFRARDNEKMFLAWLAIICNRKTSTHVNKFFIKPLFENDIDELHQCIQSIDPAMRWQLYDYYVSALRKCKGSKRTTERDINIFKLYVWADFSNEMILSIPCLSSIGGRVVDNVVNRMRKCLRKNKELFEDF
ncbi:MAG: hypothetical protein ACE5HO_14900 [bacterium]